MASKFGSSFTVNKHKKVRHLKQTRPSFKWLQRFTLIPISNLRQNHQQQQFRWTSTHLTSSSHIRCQNEEKQDSLRFLAPSLVYNVTSECFHFVLLIGFITNSQGEERSPSESFETGPMKKAASMAHVDASPRGKTRSVFNSITARFDHKKNLCKDPQFGDFYLD